MHCINVLLELSSLVVFRSLNPSPSSSVLPLLLIIHHSDLRVAPLHYLLLHSSSSPSPPLPPPHPPFLARTLHKHHLTQPIQLVRVNVTGSPRPFINMYQPIKLHTMIHVTSVFNSNDRRVHLGDVRIGSSEIRVLGCSSRYLVPASNLGFNSRGVKIATLLHPSAHQISPLFLKSSRSLTII